jgi:3-oxoacyl-[acyl-carrier-protein] synthase II
MAVAGGSEALSELTFTGFNSLKVMSPEACRPFDSNRKGLSLGEGAGVIILEDFELAEKRGATIYAELLGYALNSDAFHMTSPDPEGKGMISVMLNALKRAGIDADQVDYINAHGTATKMNDQVEAMAIQKVFGDRSLNKITVSSTKSMVGHCLGASGVIEAIATISALCNQRVPPTIHLDNPDLNCPLNHVANVSKKQKIRVALSNSFAFGGNNTSLVFKRLE